MTSSCSNFSNSIYCHINSKHLFI